MHMIMQNSYLRMANSARTSQLNIVQGDKSPIAFQLLDRRQQPITSINGQIAEISIFESKGMALREFSEARVEDGVFTFHLEQVLNTGAHEMRVKVGDYYFPSDTGTFTFNILPAHDITTEIDPTNVQTIDLVIDALADEIIDYFYPILEQTTHEYFVENAPVFRGEAFTYEDFTPEQLTELSMKVASESKDEDGNTIVTFSDGTAVTVSKGDKGDKGDTGERGVQGEIGRTGDKGERGLTGLTGAKGDKGDPLTYEELTPQQKLELKGDKGDTGDKGDKGDPLKFADLTPEQREELQQEVDYSQVAQKDHTHELSEVNGLSTELDAKANSTDHEALEQRVDGIADEEGNINAGTIPMAHTDGVDTSATIKDSIYKLEDDLNTHTHTAEEIEGLSEKIADLSNAAPAVHTHAIEDVSGLRVELDSKASTTDVDDIANELDSKAEVNHTHTDKADTVHTHTTADIDGLDDKLLDLENNSGGAPAEHTHDLADVTGLQDELDDKADKNHTHTTADIADLQPLLDGKASTGHTHSAYATKNHSHWVKNGEQLELRIMLDNDGSNTVGNSKALIPYIRENVLGDKADVEHTHTTADIAGLDTKLSELENNSGGVPEEHTHDIADVDGLVSELANKANVNDLDSKADKEHTHSAKDIDDFLKRVGEGVYYITDSGMDNPYGTTLDFRVSYDDNDGFGNRNRPLLTYLREKVLSDKADTVHTHTTADITDLQAAIDTAVSSATENKADKNHTHSEYATSDHTHSEYATSDHTHEMSNINGLTTELDNLKQSGVDAKEAISTAINSKGGTTTSTDTFDVMAQAINAISAAGGVQMEMISSNNNVSSLTFNNLNFEPDGFIFYGNYENYLINQGVHDASFYNIFNSGFAARDTVSGIIIADKNSKKVDSYTFSGESATSWVKSTRPSVNYNGNSITLNAGHNGRGFVDLNGLIIFYKQGEFDINALPKHANRSGVINF